MQQHDPAVALIGGSGFQDLAGLARARSVDLDTPFGRPSAPILEGRLGGARVLFLLRHGRGHVFTPSDVPYRANIWALCSLGAEWVIGASAVGSLKEEYRPGEIAVPDQIIDRTKGVRAASFFGPGCVAHVSFAEPYCPDLRRALAAAARAQGAPLHDSGTYVCMEGPQFSTRAEARLYRSFGAELIGMTALPEAKLAREAEMCYANLALITDYDCWREAAQEVSVGVVLAALERTVAAARAVVAAAAPAVLGARSCPCRSALKDAIMTAPESIDPDARKRLALFLPPAPEPRAP
ncbi:MAG: S-methyl-5'-thioadenosine phosphorylase [Planctomycetes bacterium]|nr:S-methyl-5'-thioadenosine phosphorylase [Planctomycetota bacterium]